MSTLDSYVSSSKPPPQVAATSQEIRDRGSTFSATVFPATSPSAAKAAIAHLKNVLHAQRPATHEVAAWRCMVLKPGCTGLAEDDFALQAGCEDDGEQHAGAKVLRVMQEESVIDAVVVVSRWYGGIMLGPARFAHFETCAREVCRAFRLQDDMATAIATLTSLDDILVSLRDEYKKLTSSRPQAGEPSSTVDGAPESGLPAPKIKPPDYKTLEKSLDVKKAKRLVTARENSIKSVKVAIQRLKEKESGAGPSRPHEHISSTVLS